MAKNNVLLPCALATWLAVLIASSPTFGSSVPPIRAVNLGGWLVVEGWITPELFKGVDSNSLMDGTHITIWSVTKKMFLSAASGGGPTVAADQSKAGDWETFRYVNTVRAQHLKSLMRANGALVFVGEWVAEWMVKGASDEDYKRFAAAQMDVYGQASFGWAYWTYKSPQRNWSLKDMINDHIITVT